MLNSKVKQLKKSIMYAWKRGRISDNQIERLLADIDNNINSKELNYFSYINDFSIGITFGIRNIEIHL